MTGTPLADRLALVTGATRGIGHAIAERLLADGARVIATGTGPEGNGPQGTDYIAVNFEDDAATRAFATQVMDHGPDILINCAGINALAPFENIDERDFERMYRVNLFAPMMICRAAVPRMRERGWGRIVNISSIWGKIARFLSYRNISG